MVLPSARPKYVKGVKFVDLMLQEFLRIKKMKKISSSTSSYDFSLKPHFVGKNFKFLTVTHQMT